MNINKTCARIELKHLLESLLEAKEEGAMLEKWTNENKDKFICLCQRLDIKKFRFTLQKKYLDSWWIKNSRKEVSFTTWRLLPEAEDLALPGVRKINGVYHSSNSIDTYMNEQEIPNVWRFFFELKHGILGDLYSYASGSIHGVFADEELCPELQSKFMKLVRSLVPVSKYVIVA